MRQLVLFLFLFLCFSCSNKKNQTDEALISTLNSATTVLAEKNEDHNKKVQRDCQTASPEAALKELCEKFSKIQRYKEDYNHEMVKVPSLGDLNSAFVKKCFEQLTLKEQETIKKYFAKSLLLNPDAIEESDQSASVLQAELRLEAEEFVREIQLLLLKDLNRSKPSFDWQHYWEK